MRFLRDTDMIMRNIQDLVYCEVTTSYKYNLAVYHHVCRECQVDFSILLSLTNLEAQ